MAEARSAPALLLEGGDRDPDRVAFVFPTGQPAGLELPQAEDAAPGWRALRLREAADMVGGLALRLRSLGVAPGAVVAVQAEVDLSRALLELAIQAAGGVGVDLAPRLDAAVVAARLRTCRAALLIVPDTRALDRLEGHLDDLPELRHVLTLTGAPGARSLVPARVDRGMLRRMVADLEPGPPGRPVGLRPGGGPVLLLGPPPELLSEVLPQALQARVPCWFVPSLDALPRALRSSHPQALVTRPAALEQLRARSEARVIAHGVIPPAALRWAALVGTACRRLEAKGQPLPRRLRLQRMLARKLVGPRARAELGGAVERVVVGEGLSDAVAAWFEALDILVWSASDPQA